MVRRITIVALVLVAALLVGAATTGLWLRSVAFNSDRRGDIIEPLGSDPEVQAALGAWAGRELRQTLDLEAFFEDVLPERGQVLAAPFGAAVENYLAEKAAAFFESDDFSALWSAVTERANEAIERLIDGDSDAVDVVDGKVVLNLVPVLNRVLAFVETEASELFGREVTLPEVGPGTPASEAIAKLETALGKELPDDFGQIVVFESDQLEAMQDAVKVFNKLVVVLVLAALVLIALTIWLSPNRRRTVMYVAAGAAVVVVLLRRVTFAAQREILDRVKVPENKAAVDNIIDRLFSSYRTLTAILLGLCVVTLVVAYLAGRGAGFEWTRRHRDQLRVGIGIAALLWLLLAEVSFGGLLVVGVIVAAVEIALTQLPGPRPDEVAAV